MGLGSAFEKTGAKTFSRGVKSGFQGTRQMGFSPHLNDAAKAFASPSAGRGISVGARAGQAANHIQANKAAYGAGGVGLAAAGGGAGYLHHRRSDHMGIDTTDQQHWNG